MNITAGMAMPESLTRVPRMHRVMPPQRQARVAGSLTAARVLSIHFNRRRRTSAMCSGTTCAMAWPSAFCSGAPVIHDKGAESRIQRPGRNILLELHGGVGDVEQGFAEADVIHEGTYSTHRAQHAHLETHCSIAWLENDRLHVRTSSQTPFLTQAKLIREPGIGLRFLDRIEISALQVFDQRDFDYFQIGSDPGNHRSLLEPRFLRRSPAAFPCDQFAPATDVAHD